ncbi:uncharacterized protein LOC144110128 [Amblyomma americanum]
MKAYPILALVVLGHLSQIRAASTNSPKRTVEGIKELQQKIYGALMSKRGDIIEAAKALKTSMDSNGDETEEQFFGALAIAVIAGVAGGAAQAGIEAAIRHG